MEDQEQGQLHADHIDETGAYGKRFEMVRELLDSGVLKEIPQEFRVVGESFAPISTGNNDFVFYDEFGQKHADHVDETGEYRRQWEAQFGPLNDENNVPVEETPVNTQWKSFLQQLIAEEKSKLNI